MKKILIGIIIGLSLSIGTFSFASTSGRLIMVPEYINGYNTIDLLTFTAQQKASIDSINKPIIVSPIVVPQLKNLKIRSTVS